MTVSAAKTAGVNRLLMEFCCSKGSKLGQATKASAGCKILRYTEEDDMTTPSGIKKAFSDLRGWTGQGDMALWSAIPCTGGSSWQYVNEVMYERTGNENALKRLKGLRSIFWKL